MSDAIIFDVDGTLANIEHRLHHIKHGSKDWDAFYAAMDRDEPNDDVIFLAELLADHPYVDFEETVLYICSGRPEDYREQTEDWLARYAPCLWSMKVELLMRPAGDFRPDTAIKREMLSHIHRQGHDVRLVIDDRQRVVDMWREEGITALQCAQWDERTGDYAEEPGELHLMVGPSGAGKSFLAATLFPISAVISSDALRAELCGTHRDMSKDRQMWTLLHTMVQARLKAGLLTVVDATNIKNKNRKEIVALAPEGTKVFYHVVDRPLLVKQRDAGWRAEVEVKGKPLVVYHDEVFRNNLVDILAGDGIPGVTVVDERASRWVE